MRISRNLDLILKLGQLIEYYIISRNLDLILKLGQLIEYYMIFLAEKLCRKHVPEPSSRLLSEFGKQSKHPIIVRNYFISTIFGKGIIKNPQKSFYFFSRTQSLLKNTIRKNKRSWNY